MRFLFLWMGCCCLAQALSGQTTIAVTIKGLKSDTAFLGYHFGGQYFTLDTTKIDTGSGSFSFTRNKLPAGLYFVASPQGRFFDFVVDRTTEHYRFEGSVAHPDSLKVFNSEENAVFLEYQRKKRDKLLDIQTQEEMFNLLQQATKDTRVLKDAANKRQVLYRGLDSLAEAQVRLHPDTWYSQMLAASRMAPTPKKMRAVVQGRLAPEYVNWVRLHYWDQIDFSDSTLLRSDVWPAYFNDFFNRWVHPMPDSAAADIDRLLARAPVNGPLYKFIVVALTKSYEASTRPGADRLFVHLVDRYQKVGQTPWVDHPTLLRLAAKADFHRPNLTSNAAPPLNLVDKNGKPVSLREVQAPFTLLIFYSPLCHHCMDMMPGIYKIWESYENKGLKAVAVSSDDQYPYWKNFIAQQKWNWIDLADPTKKNTFIPLYGAYNLPVLYLLDKDKKILWKRIPPTQLEETLSRLFPEKKQ